MKIISTMNDLQGKVGIGLYNRGPSNRNVTPGNRTHVPIGCGNVASADRTHAPTGSENASDNHRTHAPTGSENASDNHRTHAPTGRHNASVDPQAIQTRIDAVEMRRILKLYFVMGSPQCHLEPERVLHEAIKGGISLFQFREKGEGALRGDAKLKLGVSLRKICRAAGVPFIVNDDVELALELDADGIHIGQEDGDASAIRRRIGNRILGISAHDTNEVCKALEDGADYVGVGPMYETKTKKDTREVSGPERIMQIRKTYPQVPIVGIGGITPYNAAAVRAAGADGVAVITAISRSPHPRQAAESLMPH